MRSLGDLLAELERERFYGTLEVKLEAGKVVLIRKCETFKPTSNSYGDNRGDSNERERK